MKKNDNSIENKENNLADPKMNPYELVRVNVTLPRHQLDWIVLAGVRLGLDRSTVLRLAIDQYKIEYEKTNPSA